MAGSPKQKLLSVVLAGGSAVALVASFNAFVIVEPGSVGVLTHFGAVQDEILPEGLHCVVPFRTKVVALNVRVQKIEAEASASSKDLQIVTSKVALNFYLDKAHANTIFQSLGLDYRQTIIEPTIQESVKSATAKFTAEQLITQRPDVKEAIFTDIKQRLTKSQIVVTDFSILDFSFSREFNLAIESKQVAEQAALRARNDLTRIKTEAEQVRAKAEGEAQAKLELAKAEAESQRLLRETLDDQIIQLRAIERWDGHLPLSTGGDGSGAFFDVVGAARSAAAKSQGAKAAAQAGSRR